MGRYNEWGREDVNRHSSYDDGFSRRGRGRGGHSSRGGGDDYKRGRGSSYRGRGGDSGRGGGGGGYRGRSEDHGYSNYRGRGRSSHNRYDDDRGFQRGGGYRGRGGHREEERGSIHNRENSYSSREERGSRYDHGSSRRENSYSSRGSNWRSEGESESRYSSYHEKKDVAMGIIKAMLNTIEGRSSSYSSRSSHRGRYTGARDRLDYGDRSSRRHEPYRSRDDFKDSSRPRRREVDNIQDSTVDEEIEPELLNCFLCDWLQFNTKEEYLDHIRSKDHLVRLKAYHDVNDAVLEILRTNARITALQEIHEKKLRERFSDCDRCQCKIHESQKKSHTEGLEHKQVKKFLNIDCCGKLNLYMDRKGWHELSHHLLTIGHLKKVGGSKFIVTEEAKEDGEENGAEKTEDNVESVEEEQQQQSGINGADNKQSSTEGEAKAQQEPRSKFSTNCDKGDDTCRTDHKDPTNRKLSEDNAEDKNLKATSDSQQESMLPIEKEESLQVKNKDTSQDHHEHRIDCIQKMFKISSQPFQVYSPTMKIGENFVIHQARFICKPCSATLTEDAEAITEHCKSKEHYEKVRQYIESLKRNEGKSEEEEENTELFEDLDNLETVDEAVEDDDEEEEEMEEIDFSQEEIETVGEQMDSMFEEVDEANDDDEEMEEN